MFSPNFVYNAKIDLQNRFISSIPSRGQLTLVQSDKFAEFLSSQLLNMAVYVQWYNQAVCPERTSNILIVQKSHFK